MPEKLLSIKVRNYRCLRDLVVATGSINVLFGPNGVGKSTFLDALWFVRDCAIRGTDEAASTRHHGIGVLWDGADPDDRIEIALETGDAEYSISFGFSSGRIEPFVGERFRSKTRNLTLFERAIGSAEADFYHENLKQITRVKLPGPEKPAFSNYLLFTDPAPETSGFDEILHAIHLYASRSANFFQLRRLGSESTPHTFLYDRWQNLWSALRNLHGRRALDERFETILGFMRKGFPGAFRDLVFDQFGPDRVYASFVEENRRQPIAASGVSDGHLQLLGLLTALFGMLPYRATATAIFDEPETSLHPHAISVFAEAVKLAAEKWGRQIFIATHSPVLMSQFSIDDTIIFEHDPQRSTVSRRPADLLDLKDFLDHYSLGSLFMAEEVAPQSGGKRNAA
ncbi:MAG TPA: AAA family ATPase [Chthoniobacteraceae bacterium]|jgi:predicted ATPase